jgi:alkylated DNA repair dioxygenase AlkB
MQMQGQLFAEEPKIHANQVPGLTLRPEYITPSEEQSLLAQLHDGPWENDWRRRIQQYGVGYAGEGGKPAWIRDFPAWLLNLAHRVAADANMERLAENCVINEYIPPLGIAPHRDYPAFGPTIACVSLGSDIILDFIHRDRDQRIPVQVPARSLWIITGPARSEWLHGIAPRRTDLISGERRKRTRRISITFRTAKNPSIVPASHHSAVNDRPI